MLKLEITGDTHPKTVKLVTDDANAENDEIRAAFDEWEIEEGDPFRAWFDAASTDELKDGVVIPAEAVGEFGDLLEGLGSGAGMEAADEINALREQAMKEMETAE